MEIEMENCIFCNNEARRVFRAISYKNSVKLNINGELPICNECARYIIVDGNEIIESAYIQLTRKELPQVVQELIVRYLQIWDNTVPPTIAEIVKYLNNVGMMTQRGGTWAYHNCRQFLNQYGIDIEALYKEYSPGASHLSEVLNRSDVFIESKDTSKEAVTSPVSVPRGWSVS